MKFLKILLFPLITSVAAETVEIKVSQDTWVGMNEGALVLQDISPNELRMSAPVPPEAFQYNRRAVFGFDLTSVDLKGVNSVTFTAKTSQGIDATFDHGAVLRAYLVSNALDDKFNQSTATGQQLVQAGFYKTGKVPDNLVTGISIGEYTTNGVASGQTVSFKFGADALANLKTDTNKFATIIVEKRSQRNIGHDPASQKNIGMAFDSLETPGGTPAKLIMQVTPTKPPAVLISIGGVGVALQGSGQ